MIVQGCEDDPLLAPQTGSEEDAGSYGNLAPLQDLEEEMKDDYWVPRRGSKQKSPNAVRGEITRFLQEKTMSQTAWLSMIGINSGSFRKFMRLELCL